MKPVVFIAENTDAALAQIQAQLGPDAVVVSMRKLPADGMARLWKNVGKVEVTACVPEATQTLKTNFQSPEANHPAPAEKMAAHTARRWPSIAWLESNGLLPEFAAALEDKIHARHGRNPPDTPTAEWSAVRDTLAGCWHPARQAMTGTGRPHVFIGPAGSGKTTALCKWMTAAVLMEERRVRVWRLDGEGANTAEFLTLHCELLGVPAERFWNGPDAAADLQFVDLPGIETQNSGALAALHRQFSTFGQPHLHLVLNAAYENSVLSRQMEAFEPFAPEDVIFTHLDEERKRVKLWNIVLGKNFPVSFLGAGQKIPGEFRRAEPANLFPQENACKNGFFETNRAEHC